MRVEVAASWLPRAGSAESQYEDAFYPRESGPRHARRLRFAAADGASESMLSGLWADLLVRTWCRARRRRIDQVLAAAAKAWEIELAAYLETRDRDERPIQWFEQPGLERGAFATLTGIAFATGTESHGTWSAVAMGDTCLFQVRGDTLLSAFPLKSASEFDSAPKLVPSRPGDLDRILGHVETESGEWRSGDTFFLMTDAVANWFLRTVDAGATPWRTLAQFEGGAGDGFAEWVNDLRTGRQLRNDDATVLRVDVR